MIYLDLIEQGCKMDSGQAQRSVGCAELLGLNGDGSEWHWHSSVEQLTLLFRRQCSRDHAQSMELGEGGGEGRVLTLSFDIYQILGTLRVFL